jgi:hypothetical protein
MKPLRRLVALLVLALAGCAGYGGGGLVPGQSSADDVLRVMGLPAMQWTDADGTRQFAYPRGPMGVHTFMVYLGADGRLRRIDNVLDEEGFARVAPGMTKEEVLRALGPPQPEWTMYFKARDELVWEWRYCDLWAQAARFDVLFDGTHGRVRSTMSLRESQSGHCGNGFFSCWCSR